MFSLQQLFGKDKEFFALFEAGAEECRASITNLKRFLSSGGGGLPLDAFAATRRKDKQIKNEIAELLSRASVTAIEPEDIEALATSLYKIPKVVEKFVERYLLTPEIAKGVDFTAQLVLLEQAVGIIIEMLWALQDKGQHYRVGELNNRLQKVEGEADKLILELLRVLYTRRDEPIAVIVLKDLYDHLEKVVDRCRDVGNVISNIVLKNS